ncbi:anaerobic nitric oxide reductase flavorubredoxin [Alkaliphilus peptidifermentans]|uniref:Flavorubredoxin n=1 Tax=Alkaliphilus peptidifermentans DSM 18978 TaxID=1120976 RepID=A0A1G5JMW8_9FIRM|nr:anaerobic nitric oxide reductase flavorubredoxin [Alkaliphilus peptidifermentans]SCY89271.1 Flavorubredoxin [Alkaliphilus peptidifermentans DSM 18978]
MSKKLNDNITWVGNTDWELRTFHGVEYTTHRGTTYNSYLVMDEKVALIDTVWQPFSKEFIANLKKTISLDKIDYIIMNHGEPDHSGALPELMKEIPNTPIYCTENCIKSLKGHYHKDWNFVAVKTGDNLNLGRRILTFIEAKMLHWPDSMFCYLSEDNILFSNDAFGQHFASSELFNDLVDQTELYQEAIKYYANILTPFNKLVRQKIDEILALNLPVDMICPSHGIIWREDPIQIVKKYLEWSDEYIENQITIVYDTMWNGTKTMAEAIAKGIKEADKAVIVKLYNSGKADKNDIITEVFKSKAVIVGSSTINNGILYSIAGILEFLKGLKFKNKKATAFGSYGWSGESINQIKNSLEKSGFDIINDGIKVLWMPNEENMQHCIEFGHEIIKKI